MRSGKWLDPNEAFAVGQARGPVVHTPGVGALEWRNDRAVAEAYVERQAPEVAKWRAEHHLREVMADYRMGTVLFYRHDTWHRGTPLEPGTVIGHKRRLPRCRHGMDLSALT